MVDLQRARTSARATPKRLYQSARTRSYHCQCSRVNDFSNKAETSNSHLTSSRLFRLVNQNQTSGRRRTRTFSLAMPHNSGVLLNFRSIQLVYANPKMDVTAIA